MFNSRVKSFLGGIQFQAVLLVTGLATLLMAAQLVTNTIIETRKLQSESQGNALTLASKVARDMEAHLSGNAPNEASEFIASISKQENVQQLIVVDSSGMPLGIAHPNAADFELLTEHSQTLSTGETTFSIKKDTIHVAEPLWADGQIFGAVLLKIDHPSFATVAAPLVVSNLLFSVPILLLGILLSTLFVRQITGPLKRLSESATAIAAGDMDCDVPTDGPVEIQQLGQAFSLMIGKLKQNIEKVYELAFVDKITKLPNREFFRKELTRAIKRSVRQQRTGALLFVDLDGFKRVNDTYGHDIGDLLLGEFSKRLANVLRADDLIAFETANAFNSDEIDEQETDKKSRQMLARLGGDEFTVLLSEIREATDAAIVSQRIIEAVSEPFLINDLELRIGASIGIAIFPRDGSDYQTILKSADMAMYNAKDEGKNTYRYFSDELNKEASRKMMIERELRAAIANEGQLELYYQQKIDMRSGMPCAAEALIRWNHPEKGMIQPGEFISVAEDCGLILPLGKWILEEACCQINKFNEIGMDLSIAVNISTAQFSGTDLSKVVKDALDKMDTAPGKLELELTESMAMQNPELALYHIKHLKQIGVRFAIDDFGTGYSNLAQLSQIPFDVFKIDRSFVDMLSKEDQKEQGKAIVRTILAMANSLNYETVAEGVETPEQLDFLTDNGCNVAQGYYFAKPMPASKFVKWYKERQQQTGSEDLRATEEAAA